MGQQLTWLEQLEFCDKFVYETRISRAMIDVQLDPMFPCKGSLC